MSQRPGERWVGSLISARWKSERRLGRKPGPVWLSVWAGENRRQARKRLKGSLDVMCPARLSNSVIVSFIFIIIIDILVVPIVFINIIIIFFIMIFIRSIVNTIIINIIRWQELTRGGGGPLGRLGE